MKKSMMIAVAAFALTCGTAHAADNEKHLCEGILTVNTGGGTDDGTRLIHAVNINESCLFEARSSVGRKILATCRMGFSCKALVRLDDLEGDVYFIKNVLWVRR